MTQGPVPPHPPPDPAAGMVIPTAIQLADDGVVPNNPTLPLLIYTGALRLAQEPDPALLIEQVFAAHRWGDVWRNGIFAYPHYHSMIHEALGVARGRARVLFGGAGGVDLELKAGDVAVLPAGTAHQRLSASPDFLVVGAYPVTGLYDLCRATPQAYARARETIPRVPLPVTDPIHGPNGPLLTAWRG